MTSLQKIIDHFTDQSVAQVFKGFDERGKGITELAPSPLSFEHDTKHPMGANDPLMSYCPSCGIIARCNQYEYMDKKQQKAALQWIHDTVMDVFIDENPEAAEEILELVEEMQA